MQAQKCLFSKPSQRNFNKHVRRNGLGCLDINNKMPAEPAWEALWISTSISTEQPCEALWISTSIPAEPAWAALWISTSMPAEQAWEVSTSRPEEKA